MNKIIGRAWAGILLLTANLFCGADFTQAQTNVFNPLEEAVAGGGKLQSVDLATVVHGSLWSAQRSHFPPLPFNPFPDLPLYSLGRNHAFLVDDSAVDYVAIYQQREAERQMRLLAVDLGLMSATEYYALEGGGPEAAGMSYPSNSLYLEVMGLNTNAEVVLIVHGTVSGQDYALLSKQTLTNTAWIFERLVTGAINQDWTPTVAALGTRTNELYFWAVSLADSDGDGIPDFWELDQSLDGNDAGDANADPDADGYTNLDEFLLGQNPHVADPPRPTITIAATDANASEPSNPGTVTFTRTGGTTRELTVDYTVFGLARNGLDYQSLNGRAVLAIGQSTADVVIQPIDDQSYEGAEDVTIEVMSSVYYLNATNTAATVTLAEDDKPTIRLAASLDPVFEGSSTNGTFSFWRDGDTRLALAVSFTLTGTATNGVIYQTLPTSITFAPERRAPT